MSSPENRRSSSLSGLRVCLIVDNPQRDLDGLVLLSRELARRGILAFLTSLHDWHEIHLLAPDLIVANYVRLPYLSFIRMTRILGARILVLDTEGGEVNLEAFLERIKGYLELVDVYCLWGTKQFQAIAACRSNSPTRMRITGCPRYDFAAEPWSRALQSPEGAKGKFILVNTNFPLVNPRFQSSTRELKEYGSILQLSDEYLRERVRQTQMALQGMVSLVRRLALRFPDLRFILRPHPFEGSQIYERSFGDLRNIEVRLVGSVFEAMKGALAVVHHHCQTAVDASMAGVEALHVAWLATPKLELSIAAAVSRHARSPEELEQWLQGLVSGKSLPEDPVLDERRVSVANEYFCGTDGRSAERVADAIGEELAQVQAGSSRKSRLSTAACLLFRRRSLRASLQAFLYLALGSGAYRGLRAFLTGNRRASEKSFFIDRVEITLNRLNEASSDHEVVRVRPTSSRDAYLKTLGGFSSLCIFSPEKS